MIHAIIRKTIHPRSVLLSASAALLFSLAGPTPAASGTSWTDFTSATGSPGSASGTLNGIAVNYSGEVYYATIDGTSPDWQPDSSFIGGTVTASPNSVRDIIDLSGAPGTNTITFSTPVVDPVIAFWSLGENGAGNAASFTFDQTPTFEAGGPNSQFGGGAITVSGNTVSGNEGNGVVQFTGTFSSLSWTDTPETYYGFTVGLSGAPEPSASVGFALGALGLGGLLLTARRRSSQGA